MAASFVTQPVTMLLENKKRKKENDGWIQE